MSDDEFIRWGQDKRGAEQPAGDDAPPPPPPAARREAADPTQVFEPVSPAASPGEHGDLELMRQRNGRDSSRRWTLGKVAVVTVPLLVGALGVGFGLTRNQGSDASPGTPPAPAATITATLTPTSTSTTTRRPPAVATPTATARPTIDPSFEQLQALAQGDRRLVASKLDGRWVAALSSKTAGTVDPLQTTASGSHKFGWSDILTEHERLREDSRFSTEIFLTMTSAFGRQVREKPLYVTAVDRGFIDAADVRSWCEMTFADLPEAQRMNTCAPVQLSPPH